MNYSWVKYCPKLKSSTEPFQNIQIGLCRNLVKFLKTINENYLANKYWFRRIFILKCQTWLASVQLSPRLHRSHRARVSPEQAGGSNDRREGGLVPRNEIISFLASWMCQPSADYRPPGREGSGVGGWPGPSLLTDTCSSSPPVW